MAVLPFLGCTPCGLIRGGESILGTVTERTGAVAQFPPLPARWSGRFKAANAKTSRHLPICGDKIDETCETCHAKYLPNNKTE